MKSSQPAIPAAQTPREPLIYQGFPWHWPVLEELLRSTLPLIFDGVETLPGDPGEILHDMHRDILE